MRASPWCTAFSCVYLRRASHERSYVSCVSRYWPYVPSSSAVARVHRGRGFGVKPREHGLQVTAAVGLSDEVVMIREKTPGLQVNGETTCERKQRLPQKVERHCSAEEMLFVECRSRDEVDAGVAEPMERSVWPIHARSFPRPATPGAKFYDRWTQRLRRLGKRRLCRRSPKPHSYMFSTM